MFIFRTEDPEVKSSESKARDDGPDSWDVYINALPDDSTAPLRHRATTANFKTVSSLDHNEMSFTIDGQVPKLPLGDKIISGGTSCSSVTVVAQELSTSVSFLSLSDSVNNHVNKSHASPPSSASGVVASELPISSAGVGVREVKSSTNVSTASATVDGGRVMSLQEIADANDESLKRYKESLGLGGQGKDLSDPNDSRHCIILSLTMNTAGRDPVTINLTTPGSLETLKDHPFRIKEGAKFTMETKFKVQHQILSGLHYVQIVKRKGIRVSKDQEMLGSYAPNTDKTPVYTKRFSEEDAPSGMIARGHYNAVSTFVDDDRKTHLTFEWSFDISKDW